jgi:phosphoribosyl 1,2-cyclic phosphodiesterase
MKVKFWGVRGSIPVPGVSTARYGGNTTCIELKGQNGECIILDAGTGLRALGLDLLDRGVPLPLIHVFISHTHYDHIQGFPFFAPCYIPDTVIQIKGPVHFIENRSLKDVFDIQMQYDFFPVSNQQLAAEIRYETLNETIIDIGPLRVQTQFVNHPVRCLGYRFYENGRSIVFTGDHEPYYNLFDTVETSQYHESEDNALFGDAGVMVMDANRRFVDFLRDADLLVVDCQYTPDEYPSIKRGWGHSSWDHCLEWMKSSGADRMVLTHHDPIRSDNALDEILEKVRKAAQGRGIDPGKVFIAREGMEISV